MTDASDRQLLKAAGRRLLDQNEATHTPGPWEVSNRLVYMTDAGGVERYQYNVTGIIGGSSGRTIAEVGEWTDRPNAKADAALIAQAPALLAAAQTAEGVLYTLADEGAFNDDFWNEGGDGYEAFIALRDAIEGARP